VYRKLDAAQHRLITAAQSEGSRWLFSACWMPRNGIRSGMACSISGVLICYRLLKQCRGLSERDHTQLDNSIAQQQPLAGMLALGSNAVNYIRLACTPSSYNAIINRLAHFPEHVAGHKLTLSSSILLQESLKIGQSYVIASGDCSRYSPASLRTSRAKSLTKRIHDNVW